MIFKKSNYRFTVLLKTCVESMIFQFFLHLEARLAQYAIKVLFHGTMTLMFLYLLKIGTVSLKFVRGVTSNFFYQCPKSDKEYRLAIDRVRLNSTTLIEANKIDRDINHGVFIDVYPLYRCSDYKIGYFTQYLTAYLYRSVLYGNVSRNQGFLKMGIQWLVAALLPRFIKKIVLEKSSNFIKLMGGSRFLSTFYGDEVNLRYPAEWFSKSKEVLFEYRFARVSCEVEACLTKEYGNFMKYPPLEQQVPHHNYEFHDLENSYKIYRGLKFLRDKS